MRNGLIGAVAVVALTATDAGAADYRLPYRPPPCAVTSSSPVSLAETVRGKSAPYHSESMTIRNWR